jgi:hypothetical protein
MAAVENKGLLVITLKVIEHIDSYAIDATKILDHKRRIIVRILNAHQQL